MKTKNFIGILSAFLLLATALVLAANGFTLSKQNLLFSQHVASETFNIVPTNSSQLIDIIIESPEIKNDEGNLISLVLDSTFFTGVNSTKTVTIVSSAIDFSKLSLGKTYTGNITVKNNALPNEPSIINVKVLKSICDKGDISTEGKLAITDFDINNRDGDDNTWQPLDEITVEVEVENKNADESDKIDTVVELALYDSKGKEKLDLNEIDLGKIKGGNDEIATFKFKVPTDLGVDESNYFLYAKAYADSSEDTACTSQLNGDQYYTEISLDREDEDERQVVFDNQVVEPSPAVMCGEKATLTADIVNIGENDQDEVKVKIYNKELGIDLYEVLSNLDQGDNEEVSFSFTVPENAKEKSYVIELRNLYDYDEDDGRAEEDRAYGETSEAFTASFKVEGNCIEPITKSAGISAKLETPEAEVLAGSNVVIKATITNTGKEKTDYTIGVDGNEAFSTTQSITPSKITLEPGKSQDVSITLKLNEDAEGENVFDINAFFDSSTVTQPLSIILESKPVQGTGITGGAIFGNFRQNWPIWTIVGINIILIIAIIIVAVRVSRA